MLKNLLKIISIFILGILGGIFANQIFWPYFVERPLLHQYRLEQRPIYVTEKKEITIQENTALKNAIEKVEKTTIGVRTETQKGKFLEGSGLIVTSDGLAVTLADLVPQGGKFSFFLERGSFTENLVKGQILKRDLKENLALIKIEKENLPTTSFGNLEKLKLGERVFLVGTVFKKGKIGRMVNEGVIKYFDQDLIETNILEKDNLDGSVLFDIEGNILGINKIDSGGRVISLPVSKIKSFIGF